MREACCIYSEQKNCPTKGQISLVSQIAAQRTKVNSWEIHTTKVDILSFVTPKYRSLVPAIGLIYNLQYGTLNGTVSLHATPLAGITASIHLAMFLITFL